MSDLEALLEDYKDDGVTDSLGAFTVDFAKAREKLARFQLADPHEFILKLVQAGNLGAEVIDVDLRGHITVKFRGWSPDLSLEAISERLASAAFLTGDDALGYLCIGLSTLMGLFPEGLQLRLLGATGQKTLLIGKSLEWGEDNGLPAKARRLEIVVPAGDKLSPARLKSLLEERCGFSPIAILIDGKPLQPRLPETSGAHRNAFFRSNEVLASSSSLLDRQAKPPALFGQAFEGVPPVSERQSHLRLSVDLNPLASIWLTRASVLTQHLMVDLGVPGIAGVVSADDVETDLTGSQFLDGESLHNVENWMCGASRSLLETAIHRAREVKSQAQPASARAGFNTAYAWTAALISISGFVLGFPALKAMGYSSDYNLLSFVFWLFFPIAYCGAAILVKGCEKDHKSDLEAKEQILDVLLKAQVGSH